MDTDINDTTEVLQVMGHIAPLPAPFQQRLKEELYTESFKARHILLRPGDIARRVYYIKQGFLRAYFIDQSGKKHTTWFMRRGDVMISVYSFFTQSPAQEYIEVLQDCILQSLTYGQLQAYYAEFREGNLIGRTLTEKYYILSEKRSISLRTQTQEERYQYLLGEHPDIHQLTTLDNIASYLGISRETLSRMRNKMLRHSSTSA
jgi:CRP-like cAMP-binding protein